MKTKLLMVIVDDRRKEELELVLRKAGVEGYTEIPRVHGFGTTGEKMGSAVAPDTNSIIFVLTDDERLGGVVETIKHYCSACSQHIRMMHWDVTHEM